MLSYLFRDLRDSTLRSLRNVAFTVLMVTIITYLYVLVPALFSGSLSDEFGYMRHVLALACLISVICIWVEIAAYNVIESRYQAGLRRLERSHAVNRTLTSERSALLMQLNNQRGRG